MKLYQKEDEITMKQCCPQNSFFIKKKKLNNHIAQRNLIIIKVPFIFSEVEFNNISYQNIYHQRYNKKYNEMKMHDES